MVKEGQQIIESLLIAGLMSMGLVCGGGLVEGGDGKSCRSEGLKKLLRRVSSTFGRRGRKGGIEASHGIHRS
jgi:hypothetical protein